MLAGLLSAAVPLAAFQVAVVLHAPWWRLPYRSMGLVALLAGIWFSPWIVGAIRGRRSAYIVLLLTGGVWSLGSVVMAIALVSPVLGFFSLFLALYWIAALVWTEREMGRSYFDPRLRWFEGLPVPVPGVRCVLTAESESREGLKVARLDRDGAFLFSETGDFNSFKKGRRTELLFQYREKQVRGSAVPVMSLHDRRGMGFQFDGMSPDERKKMDDFIETLRGEGHA